MLDLEHLRQRPVNKLSGGELQRMAIALICIAEADIYMFDEPSSYLDVKQRLNAARSIRSLLSVTNYVVVVEHDLAVLDYLSDFVCCLYGKPGVYGVVTMPFSVREGINIFLDGFIPTENMKFRDEKLTFKVSENADEGELKHSFRHEYPKMIKVRLLVNIMPYLCLESRKIRADSRCWPFCRVSDFGVVGREWYWQDYFHPYVGRVQGW